MKSTRLNHFIKKVKFVFSKSKSISDIKNKYKYLKSDLDLLSPIIVNGSNSDLTRTRINSSIREPLISYSIDKEQVVQLDNISNQDLSSKFNSSKFRVWIITHGFADSFDEDFQLICKSLVQLYPNDLVLGLDWSTIANGLSPALSLDVYKAATWLKPISEAVMERLVQWGLAKSTPIRLIGHSLGSILATELSMRYMEKYNQKVEHLISLDPPSELTASRYQGQTYLTQLTPAISRVHSFEDVAQNSIAFVGYNSIAGNSSFASTAQASYLMKFNDIREFRNGHFWVVKAFQQFLIDGINLDSIEEFNQYLINKKILSTDSNPKFQHKAIININVDTFPGKGKKDTE